MNTRARAALMGSGLHDIWPSAQVKAKLRGEISPNAMQPAALYSAIHRTVFDCGIPAKLLAEGAGLTYQRTTDLANPTQQKPIRLTEVAALVRVSGRTDIADWLEHAIGRVAFHVPAITGTHDEMGRELAQGVKDFGAFLEENATALADSVLEAHEVGPLLQKIDTLIAALGRYRAAVNVKAAHDAPAAHTEEIACRK